MELVPTCFRVCGYLLSIGMVQGGVEVEDSQGKEGKIEK